MALSWAEIEQVEGFRGIESLVRREIIPALSDLPRETLNRDGAPKGLQMVASGAMAAFAVLFMLVIFIMPDTFFGVALPLILFPVLFFACVLGALWLNRKKVAAFVARASRRLEARGQILSRVADHVGLDYVLRPGTRPGWLDWAKRQSWIPPEARAAFEPLGGSGEMIQATQAVRDAGFLTTNVHVIGTQAQKAQLHDAMISSMNFEDGFYGSRARVGFEMLEWVERVEDSDDIHHLMILMTAPRAFDSVVQLKSKSARWWDTRVSDKPLKAVRIGPEAFRNSYDVRANDQVLAHVLFDPAVIAAMVDLTHGDAFRASAIGDQLIFEVAGANRFTLIDEATGVWDENSIRTGISDLAEALSLVDALAAAFRVPHEERAKPG